MSFAGGGPGSPQGPRTTGEPLTDLNLRVFYLVFAGKASFGIHA